MDDISKKLMDVHSVQMPGAVLLAIMDKMMSDIIDGMKRNEIAKKKGLKDSAIEEMERDLNADYTIGLFIFGEARKIFGEEFVDDYCKGEDVLPPPPAVGSSSATH